MLMRRYQSNEHTELTGLERRLPIMISMIGLLMLVNISSAVAMLMAG
jgi:hypothetical protein